MKVEAKSNHKIKKSIRKTLVRRIKGKELDDMTKRELYEMAKRKNVSGRSKMDKEQLEEKLKNK